jgi:hypothetical protein
MPPSKPVLGAVEILIVMLALVAIVFFHVNLAVSIILGVIILLIVVLVVVFRNGDDGK